MRVEANERINCFHGCHNLEKILEDGKVLCPSLINSETEPEWTTVIETIYLKSLEDYKRLTSELAETYRRRTSEENQEDDYSDEWMADLAADRGIINGTEYREAKRILFVFLSSNYKVAINRIDNEIDSSTHDRGVFEFDLPKEIVREGYYERLGGMFLVPREVDLKYATKLYTSKNHKKFNEDLKRRGLDIEVLPMK